MYLAPNALVQATRRRWITPSGMIARGSRVGGTEEQDGPDEFFSGRCPLFVLSNASRSSPPTDYVGVETHGCGLDTRHHPIHGLEHISTGVVDGSVNVASCSTDCIAFSEIAIRRVQLAEAVRHWQQLCDFVVVQDERHAAGLRQS